MFPAPLGHSALSQCLLLLWRPLSSPRKGWQRFGSAQGRPAGGCQLGASPGQATEMDVPRGAAGGIGCLLAASCDALAAGSWSWGEKGEKSGVVQPVQGSGLEHVAGMKIRSVCTGTALQRCWHCPGCSAGAPSSAPVLPGLGPRGGLSTPGGRAGSAAWGPVVLTEHGRHFA